MTDRHDPDEPLGRDGVHPDDAHGDGAYGAGEVYDQEADQRYGDGETGRVDDSDDAHGEHAHDVHDVHAHDVHAHGEHDDAHGYEAVGAHPHDEHLHDEHLHGDGAHPAPARSGPPSHRRWLVLGGAVLVLLAGLVMAWSVLSPVVAGMFESNDYDGPGHGEVAVEVEQGDTGRVIATTLVDKGVIKTVQAFEEALASTPGDEIQPGHYTLQQEMPASAALSALRSGESRTEMTVTIREGLRAVEIFPLLAEATDTPLEDYQALAENPDVLDLPDAAQGEIEGFLYPATYTFGPNDDAAAQLRAMVAQGKARYTEFNVPEDELRDVITIASIIEAEARLPEDMGKVASVIENRLRIGMGLQMDSTVAYGVGERTLTTSDEQRRDDNPYNTYLHAGLPRGPINNPGEATIRATLDPADEEYLYFVTVNPQTGETLFSQTLAEHNQNVRQFQAWCQANPGQC